MHRLLHRDNKAFTLMEMLIVVAIIAVLVAIAIPIFTSQLSKARLATDAANLRTAETLAVADMMAEYRDVATLPDNLSIQVTPNGTQIAEMPNESCAVYYFKAAGTGLEVATGENDTLASMGDFKSSYDDNLTIAVCVNASGEILAAGWVKIPTTNNGG